MRGHHSVLAHGQVISFPMPSGRSARPAPSNMAVSFDQVSFGYQDTGHPVLRDVSFDIPAGRMVALTGHAGAGKRSCIRLLQRLWDVESGAVRIGGTDVRDLPPAGLRDLFAVVPRSCRLPHEPVRDLFRLVRPGAPDRDIEAAARLCRVHETILRLPDGYDTPAELWATRLTAGERQRLALACAVLGRAPILILDELAAPQSAVDEQAWAEAVAQVRRGRTVLLIGRRLDTLKQADWIVVMEQGTVVEEGRHDHLIAWNDRYTRLIATHTLT
jgi:ABC-type multidrug transport system fused ATPase/permease subunit